SELRDELWFIEFGRGAALPLTPEEAPVDGEPVVPCAQGRVVVETVRSAPPCFATCSTYRRHPPPLVSQASTVPPVPPHPPPRDPTTSPPSLPNSFVDQHQQSSSLQSPAPRPEDLRFTRALWPSEMLPDNSPGTATDQHYQLPSSSRTSSIESEYHPHQQNAHGQSRPARKACMDLVDAMALLDETCPNVIKSPTLTPHTPLMPHPRTKRARSKSSDNSSNYSSERLNEKSQEQRKRPFLKKIGISMTEDRPLLAKLTPKIMGKPYLEKIGPSKAIDKPFLEKIGSSRTLEKFTFDIVPKKKTTTATMVEASIAEEAERMRREHIRGFSTGERRKSGKNFLAKMYSFETEDLEDTSLSMKAIHRDPMRGTSLDDVLDSGPSSMPRINEMCAMTNSDIETPSTSVAELVKCRVTTSEEIISSNSCLNSPMEISWGNSPRKRDLPQRKPTDNGTISKSANNNDSVPNSPTKRAHSSITPERVTARYKNLASVRQTSRQASEDGVLDKRKSRHEQFERRGVSSDNLTKDHRVVTPVFAEIGLNGKGSSTSMVSSGSSVRQLHDKFESQEIILTETYADFKRRTQPNLSNSSNALKRLIVRERNISPSFDTNLSSRDDKLTSEGSPKVRSKSVENQRENKLENSNRRSRTRSVLRKQHAVEEQHQLPPQRSKIPKDPSQETLDLLSELQKVKSSLKTPTVDKTYEMVELKSFPKKVLLTDQEFCLSIERENSVRRPPKVNVIEAISNSPEKRLALFEKRCLSLDYADDEKSVSVKIEPRATSLASARSPRSGELLEVGFVSCDSVSSDVFATPSDELVDKPVSVEQEVKKIESEISKNSKNKIEAAKKKKAPEEKSPRPNHCSESDATNCQQQPHQQQVNSSPKRRCQSESSEVASPKATPFRVKKRLGRISVEETVRQSESFISKECKEPSAAQKKAKCQPL
ncbi:uncharacterized protein LOC131666697, partial [Phymastichus coffea]|uniref:uncharacterized protein LOC131666697 n=1 Tax=Phymastichus coffea TaxID=108790 RepID=UPI00273BA14C